MNYFWGLFALYCLIALIRTPGEGYGAKILMFVDLFVASVFEPSRVGITISSYCQKLVETGSPPWWAVAILWFCDLFEKDHGAKAKAADIARLRAALAFLEANP